MGGSNTYKFCAKKGDLIFFKKKRSTYLKELKKKTKKANLLDFPVSIISLNLRANMRALRTFSLSDRKSYF